MPTVSRIFCVCAIDVDTGKEYSFPPWQTQDAISFLSQATQLIAHNGINYDIPAVLKCTGRQLDVTKCLDTLVCSRLMWANITDIDFSLRRKRGDAYPLESKLIGSHGLKAWGQRLGFHKDSFGEETDWQTAEYTPEMLEYCMQDVRVTVELFRKVEAKKYPSKSVLLEHQAAILLSQMERNGFHFDVKGAQKLYIDLSEKKHEIHTKLVQEFGAWYVSQGQANPKRSINYKDKTRASVTQGAAYTRVKRVEFNPASRDHIAKILTADGWKPQEFTESGKPKLDETTLASINHPRAGLLAEYFLLQKRLGQLHDGQHGWLKCVNEHGVIHGSINPNGAVTGRCTHSRPNIAQVPSVRAAYGAQCRELFTVPSNWYLLGTDASGLELRCLAHYLYEWDGGAYADIILNGDIHVANQKAANLDTRDEAKRFIYCYLYGGGDWLVGSLIAPDATTEEQELIGRKVKRQFLKGMPALRELKKWVKTQADRGYLTGLDGRQIHVRSAHSALNALLQSCGALICKHWIIETDRLCREAGLLHGQDYKLCAYVHDEQQIACRTKEIAQRVGEFANKAIRNTEKYFKINMPLDSDFNIGRTWKDTH